MLSSNRRVDRLETEMIRGKSPNWVGKNADFLIPILALCFGSQAYEEKAAQISLWAEKFGTSKLKGGYWGGDVIGADYKDPKLKNTIRLALSGQGSKQALAIITQLFWCSSGSVIMIEEPEISLHPDQQIVMMELFAEALKQGKQIICTTHSPMFLLSLGYVVGEGLLSSPKQNVAVYNVEKGEEGTTFKPLELNEDGFIIDWVPSYIETERKLFDKWVEKLESKGP